MAPDTAKAARRVRTMLMENDWAARSLSRLAMSNRPPWWRR